MRGAPAIGIVAALSLAAELTGPESGSGSTSAALSSGDAAGLSSALSAACARLATARPTAVNLMKACDDIAGEALAP